MTNFARTDMNTFQKLWDRVKQLGYRLFGNASNKERANLEALFRKASAQAQNAQAQQDGARYSIQTDNYGDKIVVIDTKQELFEGVDESEYRKIAKEYINAHFKDTVLPLSEYNLVKIGKTGIGKYLYSGKKMDAISHAKKMKAATELDNLLSTAEYLTNSPDQGNHPFASYGFDYYKTRFIVDGYVFEGIFDIGVSENGAEFYGMTHIRNVTSRYYGRYSDLLSGYKSVTRSDIANNISQLGDTVNTHSTQNFKKNSTQYSIDIDSEIDSARDSSGKTLTNEQAEYFKDSLVRDENGNLQVVYHGSGAQFTEFSYDYMSSHGSSEGQGFYFTDNPNMAEGYRKGGGSLMSGYLNIANPLSDSEVTLTRGEVTKLLKEVDPTGDDILVNYDSKGGIGYPSQTWYNRALHDTVSGIMNGSNSDSEILAQIANSGAGTEAVLSKVKSTLGYDGYIVQGKYDSANVYVAFESNQFKNADNTTPTSNPDIRYSLDLNDALAERQSNIAFNEQAQEQEQGDTRQSLYIQKTLDDPTVDEATKALIRENPDNVQFYRMRDEKITELAQQRIADEAAVSKLFEDIQGENYVPSAVDMRAMQMLERQLTNPTDRAKMTFISALSAQELGRGLGAIRHGKTKRSSGAEATSVAAIRKAVNAGIDEKLHAALNQYGQFYDMAVVSADIAYKKALESGEYSLDNGFGKLQDILKSAVQNTPQKKPTKAKLRIAIRENGMQNKMLQALSKKSTMSTIAFR